MTKINIGRLFDSNKALSTKAGQELTDMINFIQQGFDQVLRTLKNGVTIEDNFSNTVSSIGMKHATQVVVQVTNVPRHVFATKLSGPTVGDSQTEPAPQLAWFVSSQNQLVITPYFRSGNTSKTYTVQVVILYP